MRLPYRTDLTGVDVAIIGIPFDSGTSYRPGARLGPREIRSQSSLIRPFSHFQQVAPFDRLTVVDAGDVDASPVNLDLAHEAITAHVGDLIAAGAMPIAIGGDIVEVAPPFDGPGQITSLLAANLLFELVCVVARRKP
jgi:arginase family enzyme